MRSYIQLYYLLGSKFKIITFIHHALLCKNVAANESCLKYKKRPFSFDQAKKSASYKTIDFLL